MNGLLSSSKLIAFVATANRAAAREFYVGKLGLKVVSEDNFALVLDANGTMLRVTGVNNVAVGGYTILGWEVENIETTARGLIEAGITLERFDGMGQNDIGIWTVPGGGDKVIWFKDPDGNILSASQHSN